MSHHVDWSHAPARSDKGSEYFKFVAGNCYTIRPLTRPLEYLQRWTPVVCRVDAEHDPLAGKGENPKRRSSAFILDRSDSSVKIADIPASVMRSIADWCEATGKDPCGPEGTDFRIKVTGGGLQTRYSTIAVPSAPLDGISLPPREELEARLAEARRPHTPEEIAEKMGKAKIA